MSSVALSNPGRLDPLRDREFRLLLIGFVVGQGMMPLQFVASIAWMRVVAPDSIETLMVGVIGTVRGLGMILFSFLGGALADRFDRRRLLMVTQAVAFVCNIGIALVMWYSDGGTVAIAVFFALTALGSSAHAIDGPTRQAITPEILGPRLTPAGIALNSAAMQWAMPVSIFTSGFLIDSLGHGTVFAISSFGHLGEILILAMMSYRTVFSAEHRASQGTGFRESARQAGRDIAAGVQYARSKAVILWTVVFVFLMMSLIMPPTGTLGPLWVTTVVGATWSEFSYIAVFWGGGATVASLLLVRLSHIERKGLLCVAGVLAMALGFVVFTFQPTAINAIVGNFLLGVGMSTAMVSASAIIAHETPNEMRGRVMGLVFLGMGTAQAVGAPLGGVAQVLTMESLFPPLAWATFLLLALLVFVRPVVLRARVSQLPPDMESTPSSAAARRVLNGAATFIARNAPNKALSSLR